MPDSTRFRDAFGVWHRVEIDANTDGSFAVVDVAGAHRHTVEVIDGVGDGPDAALALARDYARHCHRPAPETEGVRFAA